MTLSATIGLHLFIVVPMPSGSASESSIRVRRDLFVDHKPLIVKKLHPSQGVYRIQCAPACPLMGLDEELFSAIYRVMAKVTRFTFDGGAGTYLGTAILGALITLLTVGICYPFALVLMERWRCKHTYIDRQQLIFTGSAVGLFGRCILWLFLTIITVGIYLFWVAPKLQQCKTVNTDFAAPTAPITSWAPNVLQQS